MLPPGRASTHSPDQRPTRAVLAHKRLPNAIAADSTTRDVDAIVIAPSAGRRGRHRQGDRSSWPGGVSQLQGLLKADRSPAAARAFASARRLIFIAFLTPQRIANAARAQESAHAYNGGFALLGRPSAGAMKAQGRRASARMHIKNI